MNRERLRRILMLAMMFCAAAALACTAATAVFARTLAREGYLDGALRRSGYYDELTQRVRDDCAEVLTDAGLPEAQTQQVLERYVTREQVIASVREHIAAWYGGSGDVSTSYFAQAVHWFLELYWEGTADYPSPEVNEALTAAQASCETIFRNAVRVPFANAVSILLQYKQLIWPALGAEIVLMLAALAVLFRLCSDMREFLSGASAGVLASGIGAVLAGAALLCSGYAGWRDASEPDAAAFRAWFAGYPRGLVLAGAVLLAAGAAVLVLSGRTAAASAAADTAAPEAQRAQETPQTVRSAPREAPEGRGLPAGEPAPAEAAVPVPAVRPVRPWTHAKAIGPAREVRTEKAKHIAAQKK